MCVCRGGGVCGVYGVCVCVCLLYMCVCVCVDTQIYVCAWLSLRGHSTESVIISLLVPQRKHAYQLTLQYYAAAVL